MKETRFKDTEFGKIPEDWTVTTFGDVLKTFSSGATPYRGISEYYKGKIRWISSGELNYGVITDTIEHISEEAVKNTNLKMHEPGTFLMAITGLEAAGTRGRCGIVGKPSTTNQSCLAINGTNKMLTEYLYWFYRNWGNYLAFKYCQGTKQQSYTADIVKKLPIIVPSSLPEQRRIAAALSGVDKLISCLDKKIEKKKLIKQGTMQQLLTGKKRLQGFDEPWVKVKLGEVCNTSSGGTPSRNIAMYYQGKTKWFTSSELRDCLLYDSIEHISDEAISNSSAKIFSKGTLLMAMYGATIGKMGILSTEAASNQACCAITSKELSIPFLFYWLLYDRTNIILKGCGAGQPNISQDIIKALLIPMPTIAEQRAIASVLTSMDDDIAKLEARRDKYKQVKQGMMQQLLTGRIRLVETETTANEKAQAI